jgi:hypothetical protein
LATGTRFFFFTFFNGVSRAGSPASTFTGDFFNPPLFFWTVTLLPLMLTSPGLVRRGEDARELGLEPLRELPFDPGRFTFLIFPDPTRDVRFERFSGVSA